MPYDNRWNPPELFMTHRGVDIYHAYKEDNVQEILTYWFSVPNPEEEGEYLEFDIRELPGYRSLQTAGASYHTLIEAAIDDGSLVLLLGHPVRSTDVETAYEVDVMRVATCGKTFTVQARSPGEAEKKALEKAYDTVIDNEADAEYHANVSGPRKV